MSKMAYLAGPVDQAVSDSSRAMKLSNLRARIVRELNAMGYDVFQPERAFAAGPRSGSIQRANDAVIDTAQAGVVCLPSGVPTLGTPVEVEHMLKRKLPVLILTDIKDSVQLNDWRQRGALVNDPDDLTAALLDLAHQVADRAPRGQIGQLIRQAGRDMARTLGPVPLTFEQVESKWQGEVRAEGIDLLPRRSYADDAGLDLIVAENVIIDGHEFVDVPCGVKVDLPQGMWALITGRSSTLRKRGLLVSNGVIDAGWTGELFAGVQNLKPEGTKVSAGERIAQLILLPAPVVGLVPEWGRVPAKERGENGFGSSGA